MPRWMVILLSATAAIAAFGFWGLPWLKQAMFGESRQTLVKITMAVDDFEVRQGTRTVSKTVVGMEIDFPMGSAPENTSELKVKGDEGQILDVIWPPPDSQEDIPDKGVTRWVFKEVYFPINFRQGALWNQYRELAYIKLPPVPYNPP